MKRRVKCCILAAFCLSMAGCQQAVPVVNDSGASAAQATLPPAPAVYEAPYGDASLEYESSAALYLPRKDGARLIVQQETVRFSAARHGAEAVVRALIAHPGNDLVSPLGGGVELNLAGTNPVEVSRDVCTVNLGPSALQLDHSAFYGVCQAITNTLTEFSDIQYVNILVSGAQVGLDITGTLPMGTMQRRTGEDLTMLWEQAEAQRVQLGEDSSQKQLAATATLYFPARVGNGILPEVRNISFEGQSSAQLALGLLSELSSGARYLRNVPGLPDLTALLASAPQAAEQPGVSGRTLELRFQSDLNEALIEYNVTRSSLMAALTYTMTTFIPGITGITVFIGDEWIESVTPSSVYTNEEMIQFSQGIQARSDYKSFLLGYCTLYFASADGSGLVAVERPVPCYETWNPRYLMGQLIEGPKIAYDNVTGLAPVLPFTLRDADLMGFSLKEDTMLVQFSQRFMDECAGYSPQEERLAVYAVVNTLCQHQAVRRIRLYVAGQQPETIGGGVYLPGEFLMNPGIVLSDRSNTASQMTMSAGGLPHSGFFPPRSLGSHACFTHSNNPNPCSRMIPIPQSYARAINSGPPDKISSPTVPR